MLQRDERPVGTNNQGLDLRHYMKIEYYEKLVVNNLYRYPVDEEFAKWHAQGMAYNPKTLTDLHVEFYKYLGHELVRVEEPKI